ncbi:MAG TPA: phosphate ABC transporter substrate-binding protein PstS [Thermoplasmata archaeon]|nr:phosphate ABC transporter substrate-binding protein PstS [Thermoplasmata archaeon]
MRTVELDPAEGMAVSAASRDSEPGAAVSDAERMRPIRPKVVRRSDRRWLSPVALLVALVAVAGGLGYAEDWFGGGGHSGHSSCPSGQLLQGNGAQVLNPIAVLWSHQFGSSTGDSVNYVDGGSGTGITDLTDRTIDFAATDDPLTAAEAANLPSPAVTLPVVAGAIVVIDNLPGISGHLHLSGAVLAGIYLGSITHWNDPAIAANNTGVSLPNAAILTAHRSDPAGTTYVLTDYLSRSSSAWRTGPGEGISVAFPTLSGSEGIHGNSALLTYVSTTTDSIGYSDLTDLLASSTPPGYAAMANPAGQFIVPSVTSTRSAIDDAAAAITFPPSTGSWYNVSLVDAPGSSDYPLATLMYAFVYTATDHGFSPSSAKSEVLVGWFHWILTQGQSDAMANDYVPLPASLVSVDESGLSAMTFNGAAIPICS